MNVEEFFRSVAQHKTEILAIEQEDISQLERTERIHRLLGFPSTEELSDETASLIAKTHEWANNNLSDVALLDDTTFLYEAAIAYAGLRPNESPAGMLAFCCVIVYHYLETKRLQEMFK